MSTAVIPRSEVRVWVAQRRRIVEHVLELLEAGTRQIGAAVELAKLERLDQEDVDDAAGGEVGLDEPSAVRMRDAVRELRCELSEIQTRPLQRATEAAGRLFSELSLQEDALRLASDA